jgi:hypothetical protein
MAGSSVHTTRISPHPVPLPMGEGTLFHPPCAIQASFSLWEKDRVRGNAVRPGHIAEPQALLAFVSVASLVESEHVADRFPR